MLLANVILRGTRAGQPAAATVNAGQLYFVTDEQVTERSNGTVWESYSAVGAGGKMLTVTTTGAINDLVIGSASTVRMNNATLATLQGITAGVDGQEVTIISVGTGEVDLAHQNGGSSANNRLLNFVTSGITPLKAGFGAAKYKYDGTTLRWRLISHEQGGYIDVAYAGANISGNGAMTVTTTSPDQQELAFYLTGNMLTLNAAFDTITIGGTPNTSILILLPNSYTVATVSTTTSGRLRNSGTYSMGSLVLVASSVDSTHVVVQLNGAASPGNWASGTDNAGVFFTVSFRIN